MLRSLTGLTAVLVSPLPDLPAPLSSFGAAVVGYYFPPDVGASLRRNAPREGKARVPDHAIRITAAGLEPPTPAEGFDRLYTVRLVEGEGFEATEVTGGCDAAG